MIAERVEIVWAVDEPIEGLSRDHIWSLAVRSRRGRDLTRFLNAMEMDGACDVVVLDAEGREAQFHFGLPSAQAGDTLAAAPATCENQ